jgi:nucleotide-binding universal stress UspA family protein
MRELKKILVPVDFSESSVAAVEYAIYLAQRFDASIRVLHVYDPPYYVGDVLVQAPGRPGMPMNEYIREQALTRLDEMVARIAGASNVPVQRDLISGVPHQVIVGTAKEDGSDAIVMGTHGRKGLSHLIMGSVAEQVARHAPCPVIIVRGDEAPGEEGA